MCCMRYVVALVVVAEVGFVGVDFAVDAGSVDVGFEVAVADLKYWHSISGQH